jgi:hypothetical protein
MRYRLDYGSYVDLVNAKAKEDQSWDQVIKPAQTVGTGGFFIEIVVPALVALVKPYWEKLVRDSTPIEKQAQVDPKNIIADSVVQSLDRSDDKPRKGRRRAKPGSARLS